MSKQKRIKNLDSVVMGDEPLWWEDPVSDAVLVIEDDFIQNSLNKAFNWYNYKFSHKEAYSYLKTWMKDLYEQEDLKAIGALKEWEIPTTIGWIARMLSLGCEDIPKEMLTRFSKRVDSLVQDGKKLLKDTKKIEIVKTSDWKIPENECLAIIDNYIDEYINGNHTGKETYSKLVELQFNKTEYALCRDHLNTLLEEVTIAHKGTDEDLTEMYSFLTKTQLKEYQKFLSDSVKDLTTLSQINKRVYKTRTPKVNQAKIFKNLSYTQSYDELGIKGVPIENVVHSSKTVAIFFDIKNRDLQVFMRPKDSEPFSFSGKSITNFDSDKSFCVKIRKPQETIPAFVNVNKVRTTNLIEQINGKRKPARHRINDNMILLGVH